MKTKIESSCDKATDLHDKQIPTVGSNHTCLVVIDSAFKKDKSYYPQVFLKERKYLKKEKLFY